MASTEVESLVANRFGTNTSLVHPDTLKQGASAVPFPITTIERAGMAKQKSRTSDTSMANGIKVKRQDGKIWSHLRAKWLEETPEERVRQQYLPVLVEEYGFALDQMDE